MFALFTLARRAPFVLGLLLMPLFMTSAQAQPRPDPSVLNAVNLDALQWFQDRRPTNPGSWYALLSGDPSTGPWLIVNKVLAGNFNQPHFHSYNRYIYVISGTWWVGAGSFLDPNRSVAVPRGTFIQHLINQVHWDGAKNEEVLLLISGDGPFRAPLQDNFVGR